MKKIKCNLFTQRHELQLHRARDPGRPQPNGTGNGRALVYREGDVMTFYDIDQDAWETHL